MSKRKNKPVCEQCGKASWGSCSRSNCGDLKALKATKKVDEEVPPGLEIEFDDVISEYIDMK